MEAILVFVHRTGAVHVHGGNRKRNPVRGSVAPAEIFHVANRNVKHDRRVDVAGVDHVPSTCAQPVAAFEGSY